MSPRRDALRARLEHLEVMRRLGRATDWDVLAAAGHLWREHPDALIGRELPDPRPRDLKERAAGAAEALYAVDEDTPTEEALGALEQLEEVLLVAGMLDRRRAVASQLERAVGFVRAFPEPWAARADEASARLEGLAPDDPAWSLWAAVESSAAPVPEEPGEVPPRVLQELGLPASYSIEALCGLRLAAASGLPAESPWTSLATGPGWELALTTDPDDAPILLLAGRDGRFARDGEEVAAVTTPEGLVCRAAPGRWSVRVDGRDVRFEVRP